MADGARGALAYVGDAGGVRGREEWTLSAAADGERTLRSSCWMFDTRIERHVVYTVAAGFRPVRCFVSQRRDGRFLGEGWFAFSAGTLESELVAPDGTRGAQRLALRRPLPYFVPHVVAADSWIVASYDRAAGGRQRIPGGFTCSPRPDGSTAPLAEELTGLTAELLGAQEVTVPAGTYETWHFVIRADEGVEEHVWATADGTWTMVRLRSDRLATTYQLVEHAVTGWPPVGGDRRDRG